MNEFHFIHKDLPDSDRELFFGPTTGEESFVEFDDSWSLANVMVEIGLFPSLSQARKNGQAGEIPEGFTEVRRGKNKNRKFIFILNRFE